MGLDSRWFKEDRELPQAEQAQAMKDSEKAIRNSTLIVRRLKQILEEEYQACLTKEESLSVDFSAPDFYKHVLSLHAQRKKLRDIINLLP